MIPSLLLFAPPDVIVESGRPLTYIIVVRTNDLTPSRRLLKFEHHHGNQQRKPSGSTYP